MLAVLEAAITAAQPSGSVRDGTPGHLARALLLALHGPVLSVGTMVDGSTSVDDLDRELLLLIDRYLAP